MPTIEALLLTTFSHETCNDIDILAKLEFFLSFYSFLSVSQVNVGHSFLAILFTIRFFSNLVFNIYLLFRLSLSYRSFSNPKLESSSLYVEGRVRQFFSFTYLMPLSMTLFRLKTN